jgi:hypothetical protein
VLLLAISMLSCNNETVNEPSAEHLELEKADKQLADNLKMYETIWDHIINKREIDKINETNFDNNIRLITAVIWFHGGKLKSVLS